MRKLALLVSVLAACGGGYGGGGAGATVGGVKDLNLARALIAQGVVPPADALLVEGMFAEHDLPLDGPPCAEVLCTRAAAGLAVDTDGEPKAFVQVGLSSSFDLDSFAAPPTSYVFVVDVSGSMTVTLPDETTPADLAKATMHGLVDDLRATDQVAIVAYGSDVRTHRDWTAGDARASLHAAIDELQTDGSTNMEAGVARGLDLAAEIKADDPGRAVRIVVLTDVQPNVGATSESEFVQQLQTGVAGGAYTTVLSYGTGIGAEVLRGMAQVRGANAYGLISGDDVEAWLLDEAPFFATPIAFDLRLNVDGNGWALDRGMGFPAADDGSLGLSASSVFLSRRRGALLAVLSARGQALDSLDVGLTATYLTPGGERVSELRATAEADAAPWFAQPGVRDATALGLLTEAMHDAALMYGTEPTAAIARLEAAEAAYAETIGPAPSAELLREATLAAALRSLMMQGAPQTGL